MQQDNTIPQPTSQPPSYNYTPPQPEDDRRNRPNKEHPLKSILSTIGIIIAAPLIALLLINFVFQSYEVDGPSMEQTLSNGDRLVVLKTGKTWANLQNKPYIPKRGEIIIFHKDELADFSSNERQLVKRVIGLPGERVVVREGRITVYNDEHPKGFNPDEGTDYAQNLPSETPGNVDLTVPEGEVFVSGDNRVNSLDSRSFGTVPSDQIVGELALRIYPFSGMQAF